jgi:SAM-dependent methyltransferase
MREQLNDWLGKIEIDCKTVGDIGVANNPNKERVKSFQCDEYITFDLTTELANELLNLDESYQGYYEYFDVIFCTEVLEHVIDPVLALNTIYGMLKEKGILYLSVPFMYPIHSSKDLMRYTSNGLKALLEKVGFKDIEIDESVATAGKEDLASFFAKERMHSEELRNGYTFPIGYKVKAIKK